VAKKNVNFGIILVLAISLALAVLSLTGGCPMHR